MRRRLASLLAAGTVVATACSGGGAPAGSATPTVSYGLGRYQPVWPFAGAGEAAGWQRRYRASGQQPWRLSADQTALAFVRYLGFDSLGFDGIDRVTRRSGSGGDAHIAVGHGATAAVIHLVRLGVGTDAPWEVVGTDDTDLRVVAPAYGAAVSSPVAVGGRLTGVDERVRVEVRQRSTAAPLGRSCCVSAGRAGGWWSTTVPFKGATDGVVTIVASTGGHVAKAERFAVTAVRVSR